MLIYSIVAPEERNSWKTEGHPFNRADLLVMEFVPGTDLKERLIRSEKPGLLVLDEACFGGEASSFLRDLRDIRAWEAVHTVILLGSHQAAQKDEAGLTFLRKPVGAEAYETLVKTTNIVPPRRYPRRDVMAPCAIIAVGKRVDCRIRDISVCGCKIDYDGEMNVGGMVQIGFSLKFAYKTVFVKATAKVVRGIKGGYGLSFLTMEPQSRSVIAAYVKG